MRSLFVALFGIVAVFTLTLTIASCESEGDGSGLGLLLDGSLNPGFETSVPDAAREGAARPETSLTSTPPALTNAATATFRFASTEGDGTFACQLDEQTPTECTSPHSVTVTEGVHTFKVAAVSALSVDAVDLTPAAFTWTVDLTPPKTTVTKSPPTLDNSPTATFEFTVSEAGTTACVVDQGAAAPCTSPFTTAALADGAHTLKVVATDRAGNPETPTTFSWTIDSATPDTTIDSGPTNAVQARTASFTFSSPATGAITFTCALDAAAFTACTSPAAFTNLAEGAHTFQVRARSAVGNTDITPAARTWTVDITPPDVTITVGPTGPTNMAQPTFEFTTAGATATQCRFDAGAFAVCTSPLTAGAALAQGAHTFEVRAADAAGNTATRARTFSIDTANPTVAITGGPSGPTNVVLPVFTFTKEAGATTQCRIDTGVFAACTSPFTSPTLADGPHTFEVRAVDAATNTASATRSFIVDTVPPTVTIASGPNGPTNDNTPTFGFTTTGSTTECAIDGVFAPCVSPFTAAAVLDGSHTFTVRARDLANNTATAARAFSVDTAAPSITITSGPSGPTRFAALVYNFVAGVGTTATECRIDGAAFATCASPFTSAALSDGPHTFDVRALDALGNFATASRSVTVDTVPPTATITGGPNGPTNVATPQFTFTVAGNPTTTQCRIDTAPYVACTSPFTSATLAQGAHTFEVRVVDAATNATSATRAFTVDTVLPTITITSGPAGVTTVNRPQWAFTSGGGATVTRCSVDGAAFANCTSPFTSALLPDGPHTFDVRAFDAAGNFATATRSITIDTVPPVATITGGPSGPTMNTFPTFTFTATGATRFACNVGGAFTACNGGSYNPPATLVDGPYTFTVRAYDAANNFGEATRSFIVDTVYPSVTVTFGPRAAVTNQTVGFTIAVEAGATTRCRWYRPADMASTAFVPCTAPNVTMTTPASAGQWLFYATATDAAGNMATGGWNVTVR